jgi:hypothetical protein
MPFFSKAVSEVKEKYAKCGTESQSFFFCFNAGKIVISLLLILKTRISETPKKNFKMEGYRDGKCNKEKFYIHPMVLD